MLRERSLKRVIGIVMCFVFSFGIIQPCYAEENDDTIKVGFFLFDGYHDMDDNGNLSGYGYDITNYMDEYIEESFEYCGYDMSWQEAQDALESGEIDLLTSAQKTDERLEKFDYSDQSIGTSATIITVKEGNTKFILNDCENWNGIRVGMIEGNSRNDSFDNYAVDNGFSYVPVYYTSTEEMIDALQEGQDVDAIVSSNLRKTDDEWVLAQFDAAPFYVIVKKGNTELLERINNTLDILYNDYPNLNEVLMDKYYHTESGDDVAFTVEESNIISLSQITPIRVGVMLSGEPICYWDDNSDSCKGISIDIIDEISDKTGLEFEYVVINQKENSPIDELKNGNVDVIARIFQTEQFTSDSELIFSDSMMTESIAIVCRSEENFSKDSEGKSIAIPSGFQTGKTYAENNFENSDVIEYETVEDCLDALTDGEVDASIYFYYRMAYMLHKPQYVNLSILPSFSIELPSSIIGLSGKDEDVIQIINKGLSMITDAERNAIIINSTIMNTYEFSFSDILYKYRFEIIILIIFIIVLITGGIVIIHTKQEINQKLQFAYDQAKDALLIAEQANSAKSQFLSRVSHELRTPLNAIIGFLELSKNAEGEQAENYRVSTDVAAKQLLNVINDVLDMSSIEAGKLKITESPFCFKNLIISLTNMYGTQCKQKGVIYETNILTPTDDWLVGDELRINQILMNLLGNSVKFTSQGKIALNISKTITKNDKIFMRFEVLDTGCGMSDEMKNRLFKPFEQESSSTAKRYGGSGLGLSIVNSLVAMMGGTIRVDSVQGEGTKFTVDIPFKESSIESEGVFPTKIEKMRILSVDDEETEREYISIILKRMGVRFTCVNTGKEALKELEKSEKENDMYNVCIIDWRMPEMNGIETTRIIREKYQKDIVVIIVSAYDFHQVGESIKKTGANMFISKPLFQSSIFNLLMTLSGGEIVRQEKEANTNLWDFMGKRVMLVEDNPLNQIVANAFLTNYNLVVDIADNGQIAVEKFISSEPGYYDAILMDIQMPVMDGFEATKAIRKSSHVQAKTIQIIAQTADAFNEDITKTLSCGMNDHVAKPIDHDLLAEALYRALNQNSVDEETKE